MFQGFAFSSLKITYFLNERLNRAQLLHSMNDEQTPCQTTEGRQYIDNNQKHIFTARTVKAQPWRNASPIGLAHGEMEHFRQPMFSGTCCSTWRQAAFLNRPALAIQFSHQNPSPMPTHAEKNRPEGRQKT
jgi:hypothetical protein